jgi:hypothetical protein
MAHEQQSPPAGPAYPPMSGTEPKIFTQQDFAEWEDALQKLAVVNHILQRCERCKLPVEAARADCDGLCSFYNSLMAEFKGPQSPIPVK